MPSFDCISISADQHPHHYQDTVRVIIANAPNGRKKVVRSQEMPTR